MFFIRNALHSPLRIGLTFLKHNNFQVTRKSITTTPIRSDLFNVGKRMTYEQYYKELDKIEPTYELIYRAPFHNLTAFCRHVPTFSLITVSLVIAYKLATGIDVIDTTAKVTIGPTLIEDWELTVFLVLFYVINLGLAYIVNKYPLRIYKLKNQYLAIFEGYLPRFPRQYSFRKGDVYPTKSITPWYETTYKMKNRTVLVFSHHFKKPADFNDMLRK